MRKRALLGGLLLVVLLVVGWVGVADGAAPDEAEPRLRSYSWMSLEDWNARHERNVARRDAGDIELLFMGDSITQGWGNNEVWREHYGDKKAANFGIGGDTTQHVLWRITEGGELDGLSPKVAVLLIGTNNIGREGATAGDIARGVLKVVSTMREKMPETKLLVLGVFPRGRGADDGARETIRQINAGVAGADDGEWVRYLDIGDHFVEGDGSISRRVMPDFLHLSGEGYGIWAERMGPLLGEMLGG